MRDRDIREIKRLVNELVVAIRAGEEAMRVQEKTTMPTVQVTNIAGKAHELNQRIASHRTF